MEDKMGILGLLCLSYMHHPSSWHDSTLNKYGRNKEKKVGRKGGREGKGREGKTEGGGRKQRKKKGVRLWDTMGTFYYHKWIIILRIKKIIFKFKDSHPNSQKRECNAFKNSQNSKLEVIPRHFLKWFVKQKVGRLLENNMMNTSSQHNSLRKILYQLAFLLFCNWVTGLSTYRDAILWNLLSIQMFFRWICEGESGLLILFLHHLQECHFGSSIQFLLTPWHHDILDCVHSYVDSQLLVIHIK